MHASAPTDALFLVGEWVFKREERKREKRKVIRD